MILTWGVFHSAVRKPSLARTAFRVMMLSMIGFLSVEACAKTIVGNPSDYLSKLRSLAPGDVLFLAAGTYRQDLPVHKLNGSPDAWITIEGPQTGAPAEFLARPRTNTISIGNSSYVVIRNLKLEGTGQDADAVKGEIKTRWAHHITIENLTINGYNASQQDVAISTKCPAWNWVIRNNVINGAGTGMYLGDSDGSAPFIAGVIENNLVTDTRGYNIEIKHQVRRPVGLPDLGPGPFDTIIRYNVFSKEHNGSVENMARPNVLVGHFPKHGPGAEDRYLIYGNFFYQNPTERLFQGEGTVALYDNLFINDVGDAISIQPHKWIPRRIQIFHNTVLARDAGILVTGAPATEVQEVIGNAVFAAQPLRGGDHRGNFVAARSAAKRSLVNPTSRDALDLHPVDDSLKGMPEANQLMEMFQDGSCDFDGRLRDGSFRGAYAGRGTSARWRPELTRQPHVEPCAK